MEYKLVIDLLCYLQIRLNGIKTGIIMSNKVIYRFTFYWAFAEIFPPQKKIGEGEYGSEPIFFKLPHGAKPLEARGEATSV